MFEKLRNHIDLIDKREFLVEEYLIRKMLQKSRRKK